MLYFPILIFISEAVLMLVTVLFMVHYSPPKPYHFAYFHLKDQISQAPSIKENIDFVLYQSIRIIYNKIKFYNYLKFLIIAFSIYWTLEGINLNIAILFSSFFYYLAFFIILVKITYNWIDNILFKDNFPLFHSIILYLLVSLLVYNIYLFVINLIWICNLIFSFLKGYILKSNILSKLKDLKLDLEYKYYKSKNPKGPKGLQFFTTKEKKDKDKRALELKEKLLKILTKNTRDNTSDAALKPEKISFSQRRNWKETINIGERPDISNSDLIKNIKKEFNHYDINEKKFKEIVVNIGKGKEGFYPNDSISGFNESINIIKKLKSNLKSMIKNVKDLNK